MEIKPVDSGVQNKPTAKNGLQLLLKQKVTIRLVIQTLIVIILITSAWRYYGFYQYLQGAETAGAPYRPPVVEGFLPIAAIVAIKAISITGTIDPIHPAGLVILMIILLTGLIFKRALCSWICPLGTLSEYLGKLGHKVMGRNLRIPAWLDIMLLVGKYLLFIYIFKVFILLPANEAFSFMQIPYYTISDVKMFEVFLRIGLMGVAFIAGLMLLSFLFKSFWCRYLCPYGALVGILGIFSPFVLQKNSTTCTKCGCCNQVCPNNVNIQDKERLVISSECTGCTACVTACPKKETLELKLFGYWSVKPSTFAVSFIVIFFGLIGLAMLTGYWHSSVSPQEYQAIYRAMSGSSGF